MINQAKFTAILTGVCLVAGGLALSFPSLAYSQEIPVTLEQDYKTFNGDIYDDKAPGLTEQELKDARDKNNPSFPTGTFIVEADLFHLNKNHSLLGKISYGQLSKKTDIKLDDGTNIQLLLNFKQNGNGGYLKHELLNLQGDECERYGNGFVRCHRSFVASIDENNRISGRNRIAGLDNWDKDFRPIAVDGVFITNDGESSLKIDWQTFDYFGNIIETTRPIEHTPIVNNTLNTPISGGFTASPRP